MGSFFGCLTRTSNLGTARTGAQKDLRICRNVCSSIIDITGGSEIDTVPRRPHNTPWYGDVSSSLSDHAIVHAIDQYASQCPWIVELFIVCCSFFDYLSCFVLCLISLSHVTNVPETKWVFTLGRLMHLWLLPDHEKAKCEYPMRRIVDGFQSDSPDHFRRQFEMHYRSYLDKCICILPIKPHM